MYRRQFLKVCGLSGLLYFANWRTLIRGPKSGDTVYRGWFRKEASTFLIAGTLVKQGDIVTMKADGEIYPFQTMDIEPAGIAMYDVNSDEKVDVMIKGSLMFDASPPDEFVRAELSKFEGQIKNYENN